MKNFDIYHLLKSLANNPALKRKLKIFAIVGAVGLVVTSALAIWAAVATFNFVASYVTPINIPQTIEAARGSIADAPPLLNGGCWNKTKSMLDVATWLEKPIATNLEALREACVSKPEVPIQTDQGGVI